MKSITRRGAAMVIGLISAPSAHATWSIVVADSQTNEVGIASVTCVANINLLTLTPVMLVGVGGGVCQAAADPNGVRRPIIHDQLLIGTPPPQIISILAGVSGHQQRQYGIVDTLGRTATFTG